MKDENGNVIYEKDENGELKMDAEGRPIPVLPEGLTVTANGSGYKSSSVGLHSARYDLTIADSDNYEFGTFGSGLNVTKTSNGYYAMLSWEIETLELALPQVPEEEIVFDQTNAPNLLELLFPDNEFFWNNWSDYVTVKVEYTDDIYSSDRELLDGFTAENAGRYYLTFTVIDPNNVSFEDGSLEQTVSVDVNPYVITITGWNNGHRPIFEPEAVPSGYYELVYTYVDPETGEEKTTTVTPTAKNIEYTARVRVKEELEGNVTIACKDGDETLLEHKFILTDTLPQDSKPIKIPVLSETQLTYNGKAQQLTLTPFDSDFLEISVTNKGEVTGNTVTLTNAGTYEITISFKAGRKGHWDSEGSMYHETQVSITYEVEVGKLYIPLSWKTNKGIPEIELPEEYASLKVTYEFRDPATGKTVMKEALVKDTNYQVTVTLKDGENVEFEYEDENGERKTGVSAVNEFTFKVSSNALNELFGLPDDFPLWQIIVITVCLILFIIFMILTAKKRKEKKEAEEEMKKYQEDMEELSEE